MTSTRRMLLLLNQDPWCTIKDLDSQVHLTHDMGPQFLHENGCLQEDALVAFNRFIKTYDAKYPKACECLNKDKASLLAFYDFPAEHWSHIRTTNPIESTFATVRLRTNTRGGGRQKALYPLCSS